MLGVLVDTACALLVVSVILFIALPITVTSISIQTVGVPHAQADNKAVDQATSSCPTATNTVKVPRNEAARSRDVGGHGASYLQEHVAPHRSSLGCKQLQNSPVAANKRASRPSSAPSGLNRSERERNANSCFFICKPAVCHPRPPSKQISVECTDDSFPYPSPLPLPPSQLDIAEQFEERMSELARLQRETVLYEKHQRHTRQLHRSVSKQSLTKASSYQTGNATQSRGKRSEKRGSCTSLDAFSNAALAQQRQLASVSSPHIGSQSRRHSVSSRPSQTGSRSKSKRHKRSLRRHSVAP